MSLKNIVCNCLIIRESCTKRNTTFNKYSCEGFEFGNNLIYLVKPFFCLNLQCRENEVGVKAVGGSVWLLEESLRRIV